MIGGLLYWIVEAIYPKENVYIPFNEIETDEIAALKNKLKLLNEIDVSELTYSDHGLELNLHTVNFEDLFRRLEELARFVLGHREVEDLNKIDNTQEITLISYRLGCKRYYKNFNEIKNIFCSISIDLIEVLLNGREEVKLYMVRHFKFLISDIEVITNALILRYNNDTL